GVWVKYGVLGGILYALAGPGGDRAEHAPRPASLRRVVGGARRARQLLQLGTKANERFAALVLVAQLSLELEDVAEQALLRFFGAALARQRFLDLVLPGESPGA